MPAEITQQPASMEVERREMTRPPDPLLNKGDTPFAPDLELVPELDQLAPRQEPSAHDVQRAPLNRERSRMIGHEAYLTHDGEVALKTRIALPGKRVPKKKQMTDMVVAALDIHFQESIFVLYEIVVTTKWRQECLLTREWYQESIKRMK